MPTALGQKPPVWATLWGEDCAFSLLRSSVTHLSCPACWQRSCAEEEGTTGALADRPLHRGLCGPLRGQHWPGP